MIGRIQSILLSFILIIVVNIRIFISGTICNWNVDVKSMNFGVSGSRSIISFFFSLDIESAIYELGSGLVIWSQVVPRLKIDIDLNGSSADKLSL